ncbi:transcriptional adapter 2-alpha isoform X1 [Lethenteron reissneri]|uniref:transcriptional adapter 2-alpha isoform X1 n=1 Tax=Lethenteron reissneri TaxID=7753 RepID=UPI002AB75AB5|nr:transcriptional adapter 2-alpha isoform X1 [Lethenteron reissneri]
MDRLSAVDPFARPPCPGCSSYLVEPYIKCSQCGPPPLLLCLQCFAQGLELRSHRSEHSYEIVTTDFPVLDIGWTAQEEMTLLEAVLDCGLGNWQDVANQMRRKSKEECEWHYMERYINNPHFASPAAGTGPSDRAEATAVAAPIAFQACEDPPRPGLDSAVAREMAGYMPARSDFCQEFDNYAEWDLRDIDFVEDDSDVLRALKMAVVEIYHSRLKERQRRKKIVRDYGLINLRKFQVLERQNSKEVRDLSEAIRPFAKTMKPLEMDKLIESYALECELRKDVQRLQDYRVCGVTTFRGARVYERLLVRREEEKLRRTVLQDVMQYVQDPNACQQWLQRQAALDAGRNPGGPIIPSLGRRNAPPLDLTGLPGTERLNEQEKELCQAVRLVPEAYLEYRGALAAESRKLGGLRLAQARALIKIDVNKTRKLYDFLLREGYISKVV